MGKIISIIHMMFWWFYIPLIAFGQFMHNDWEYSFSDLWKIYWRFVVEDWRT